MESNKITTLCKIGARYGTDKSPLIKHAYTPFYYSLLSSKRKTIKKVLEIGVGYFKDMENTDIIYDPGLKRYLHKGASLYMWQEFFPNAQIYGADIRPEAVFKDERIQTFLCDERKVKDIQKLISKTGSDIDLVIDDGSHHLEDQLFLIQNLMPLLQKDVTYIIEDVGYCNRICKTLEKSYDLEVPKIPKTWPGGWLIVVKNKT